MIDVRPIIDAVVSHALASGRFDRVNRHEPKAKNPAGAGITCAIWMQTLRPVPSSGLAATSGRLEMTVRIYTNMLAEPQDDIDPQVTGAVLVLMGAYSGDLDLGEQVRCVDLLGMHGEPMQATAGYLNLDGRLYRVVDILLPVIVNDIWAQSTGGA